MARRRRVEGDNREPQQQLRPRGCAMPVPVRVAVVGYMSYFAWQLVKMDKPLSAIGTVGMMLSAVGIMVSNAVIPNGPLADKALNVSAVALGVTTLFAAAAGSYEFSPEHNSLSSNRYF